MGVSNVLEAAIADEHWMGNSLAVVKLGSSEDTDNWGKRIESVVVRFAWVDRSMMSLALVVS